MQLRHARYFIATAEAGTVSGAAAAVHVTQPALSRQLRQLEADLGVDLFERRAGRLVLSRTGRALLPAARAVLAAVEEMRATASFLAHDHLQRVSIAAPTVTLTDVVQPFVATMSPDDPIIDVRAADGFSATELLDGGADLVIGLRPAPAPYLARPLAELPVRAFVPRGDPWASRERVALEELVARPLIVPPPTFASRQALDAAVANSGVSPGSVLEVANGTIAQAMAAAGRGVGVVSDDPRFELVALPIAVNEALLRIRLHVGWDARRPAAGDLESLASRLVDFVHRRYGTAE